MSPKGLDTELKFQVLEMIKKKKGKKLSDVSINPVDLINGYIEAIDWRVNENSNIGYSYQGLKNYITGAVEASYWLNFLYPERISKTHEKADLHIHDLGSICVYCCGWSLEDLLLKGFTGVPGKISCAPPKHLRTAMGQVVNFMYTLQHEAAGAQAFSNFDTYLAPFIRYDKLGYEEVKQIIQEFLFSMNVPTRVGGQSPFTNITLDIVPSGKLAEQSVIIGGKYMKERYKDFAPEMKIFNKAYAELMMKGDAVGRVFSFPIPTYNITKDFNWNDPDLEPVWEMTAKYGIPYFSNFINSDMDPDDARSMCCRLRLDNRMLIKKGGGLFGANPLTGSIGVVTINLPRIGYLAKDKKDFFKRLGKLMDVAKDSLLIKRNVLEEFTEMNLYPYCKFSLEDVKLRTGKYWTNHFNTIGLVGLNEAVLNFMNTDLTSKKGQGFGVEVLEHMRQKMMQYQEDTGEMFNLEATPAEGTSYRFAKHDKKKYPDIITATDKYSKGEGEPYYSNSSQLPVKFSEDLFEALDLQDELQCKYTGGTVFHAYIGERLSSGDSAKNLVKKVCENYNMPYFSLTPTFSICPEHGYMNGEKPSCEQCGKACEVYSRIVGYLRPVNQWNKGKKSEWAQRVFYDTN